MFITYLEARYKQFQLISRRQLDSVYRKETNASSKNTAETELGKTRTWAYKWLHRFDKDGLDGLKDQPRSGKPPDVPKDANDKNKAGISRQ